MNEFTEFQWIKLENENWIVVKIGYDTFLRVGDTSYHNFHEIIE